MKKIIIDEIVRKYQNYTFSKKNILLVFAEKILSNVPIMIYY